jgi:membrane protease YdiL (CAAX protease family)
VAFFATTAIYAFVHIWSLNFMLIVAAAVAGGVWGLLYRLFPERLWALVISHAVWDAAVFVLFPI